MHPSYWQSVSLGPNFTGMGSSTAKVLIPFDRWLIVLQLCGWKFFDSETFVVEISAKNGKFGYLNPMLRKLRVMHDLGCWLIN